MFTHDEMRFLRDCSENEIMDEIIHKMTLVNCNGRPVKKTDTKPKVLIILSRGSFQFAYADRDLEVVISDRDNIDKGDDLYYPCLTGDTETEFEAAAQVEYERVLLYKAKEKRDEPLKEARIFIHDEKDAFPYNVQIEGDVLVTYKTFDEALTFLIDYNEARSK